MKTLINYIFLTATICYTSTSILAAPINTARLIVPYQTSDSTSVDAREFGLSSSSEPLALRMYNEVLNARTINAQTTETDFFSREPSVFTTLLAKGKDYLANHPEHLAKAQSYLEDHPEHVAKVQSMIMKQFHKHMS